MDLLTSTPKEVADYFLQSRFKNDASSAATFLLQVIDELGDVEELAAQLMQQQGSDKLQQQNDNHQDCHKTVETSTTDMKPSEDISDPNYRENEVMRNIGGDPMSLPRPISSTNTKKAAAGEADPGLLVSATTPRTKLTLTVHPNGIAFKSPKNECIVITPDDVRLIIVFPKREDCIKAPKTTKDGSRILIPGSQVLILLEATDESRKPVTFRNKNLSQICFVLPNHHSRDIPSMEHPSSEQLRNICIDDFENKVLDAFKASLKCSAHRVYNPKYHEVAKLSSSSYVFQSDDGGNEKSIMHGKMPYMKCYSGVRDGVLYPMLEGLLFFKPPLFFHRNEIKSIACGRGGGGSRFVDLQIVLEKDSTDGDGKEIEFTNIDREEQKGLSSYIHTLVEAMTKEVDDDSKDGDSRVRCNDGSDEKEPGGSGNKRPCRAASMEARKVTKLHLQSNASGASAKQGTTVENDTVGESDDDEDGDYEGNVEENDSEPDESDAGIIEKDYKEDNDYDDSSDLHDSATESEDDA